MTEPRTPSKRSRRRRRRPAQDRKPASVATPEVAPELTEGRAVSESLQAAILAHTSDAVLARGRGYAKRNRVSQLRFGAGTVRARVLGSVDERYRVELSTPQRPAPIVVTKIRWACDCPYAAEHRRGTCKHVVAVALVAARRLERSDPMRRRWLGQPAAEAVEAEPAELDALADRLVATFTVEPVGVDEVLARAIAIAPPPFAVDATISARRAR